MRVLSRRRTIAAMATARGAVIVAVALAGAALFVSGCGEEAYMAEGDAIKIKG